MVTRRTSAPASYSDGIGMAAKSVEKAFSANFWRKDACRDDSVDCVPGCYHFSPKSKTDPLLLGDLRWPLGKRWPLGDSCDSRSPSRSRGNQVAGILDKARAGSRDKTCHLSKSPERGRLNNIFAGEGETDLLKQDIPGRLGSGCQSSRGRRHYSTVPSPNPLLVGDSPTERSIYRSSSQRAHSRTPSASRKTPRSSRVDQQSPGVSAFFKSELLPPPKEGVKRHPSARQTSSENLKFSAVSVGCESQRHVCRRRLLAETNTSVEPPWSLNSKGDEFPGSQPSSPARSRGGLNNYLADKGETDVFKQDTIARHDSVCQSSRGRRHQVDINSVSPPRSPKIGFSLPASVGRLGRQPSLARQSLEVGVAPWSVNTADFPLHDIKDFRAPEYKPQIEGVESNTTCKRNGMSFSPPHTRSIVLEAGSQSPPACRSVLAASNDGTRRHARASGRCLEYGSSISDVNILNNMLLDTTNYTKGGRFRGSGNKLSDSFVGTPTDFKVYADGFVGDMAKRSAITGLNNAIDEWHSTVQPQSRSWSAEPRRCSGKDWSSSCWSGVQRATGAENSKHSVADRIELLKIEFQQLKAQLRQLDHTRHEASQSSHTMKADNKLKNSLSSLTTRDSSGSERSWNAQTS